MWGSLYVVMFIVYVVCCVGLIVIVLLQKGKGTGFAGAFGVGAGSDTVFGPRMSKSLPVRLTYIMAGLVLSLALLMSLIAGSAFKGSAPGKISGAGGKTQVLTDLDEDEPVPAAEAEQQETGPAPSETPAQQPSAQIPGIPLMPPQGAGSVQGTEGTTSQSAEPPADNAG